MFELPEVVTLAMQMNQTIRGKTVTQGSLGNKPHKFVWYNRSHEEFARLVPGKTVGEARTRGRWLFVSLLPGYVLTFGEFGGRLLYHAPGASVPATYHLLVSFDDGSSLTALTQMWGAMELFDSGQELERKYVKDMRPTPLEPEFTFDYFSQLVDEQSREKRSVKGLLTQDQLIPGLGNAIAQDIMFRARLNPKRMISALTVEQRRVLYDAVGTVIREAIDEGGRSDEHDLHDRPGGYMRIMDKDAAGKPCPACGHAVKKIQYLGGACYFCPSCQS